MGTAFELLAMHFENWHEALSTLAALTAKGEVIILLDELSWIASKDKDFAGKLKGVWDTKLKKQSTDPDPVWFRHILDRRQHPQ